MKYYTLPSLVLTAVLAAAGYFLLDSGVINPSPAFSIAIGVLIGSLVVPVINGLLETKQSANTEQPLNGDITTLYVGNLPYRASENAVMEHFSTLGHVESVRLMKDRRTGKRKGYGFVEMAAADADNAIKKLNDTEFHERTLKVRLAKDKVSAA